MVENIKAEISLVFLMTTPSWAASLTSFPKQRQRVQGKAAVFPKLATPDKAFSRKLGKKCELAGDLQKVPFLLAVKRRTGNCRAALCKGRLPA